MEIIPRILNFLIMIIVPIMVAWYIGKRVKYPWRLFFIGAGTFVLSQVLHLPFNSLVLEDLMLRWGFTARSEGINLVMWAAFYGLSAGVFEGVARYMALRFWAKEDSSWLNAMMYGVGHGGGEAIILGVLVGINTMVLIAYRGSDISALVPPEQLDVTLVVVEQFWSYPWYGAILGGIERIWAIVLHLAATVLVFQAIRRKNIAWLFLGIVLHALFDGVALYAVRFWSPYAVEGLLGVFALLSLGIIFGLRSPEPEPEVVELEPLPPLKEIGPLEISEHKIDDSRFMD
jgi:uncharacterized membrane protein YhfC